MPSTPNALRTDPSYAIDLAILNRLNNLYIAACAVNEHDFSPEQKEERAKYKYSLYKQIRRKEAELYKKHSGSIFYDIDAINKAMDDMEGALQRLDDIAKYLAFFKELLKLISIVVKPLASPVHGFSPMPHELFDNEYDIENNVEHEMPVFAHTNDDYLTQLLNERDFLREALLKALCCTKS